MHNIDVGICHFVLFLRHRVDMSISHTIKTFRLLSREKEEIFNNLLEKQKKIHE